MGADYSEVELPNFDSGKEYGIEKVTDDNSVFIISSLLRQNDKNIVHVVSNNDEIERLKRLLIYVVPHDVKVITLVDFGLDIDDLRSPTLAVKGQRLQAFYDLITCEESSTRYILLLTVDSMVFDLVPKSMMRDLSITLRANDECNLDQLLRTLVDWGYVRVSQVFEIGDFSVRGGVLDIYTCDLKGPIRIDFFGSKIEKIKYFNQVTQLSLDDVDQCLILPISEVILNEKHKQSFINNIEQRCEDITDNDFLLSLYNAIDALCYHEKIEYFLQFLYNDKGSIFDYISNFMLLIPDSLEEIVRQKNEMFIKFLENQKIKFLFDLGKDSGITLSNMLSYEDLHELCMEMSYKVISLSRFNQTKKRLDNSCEYKEYGLLPMPSGDIEESIVMLLKQHDFLIGNDKE